MFKRNFNNFNEREFRDSVNDIIAQKDPHISLNDFYNDITYKLDEKKVSIREYKLNFKPWIKKEILDEIKNRDSLLNLISKENDPIKEPGRVSKTSLVKCSLWKVSITKNTKRVYNYSWDKNRSLHCIVVTFPPFICFHLGSFRY